MTPYAFVENIETEVPTTETGILSKTLFNDEALKVVAFGFAQDHELPTHTAPMAAILYFINPTFAVGGHFGLFWAPNRS
jgi:quercetin dioxygenase-like cupin family protein